MEVAEVLALTLEGALNLVSTGTSTFVGGRALTSPSSAFLTLGSRTLTLLVVRMAENLILLAAGSLTLTPFGALASLIVAAVGP